MSRRRVVIVGTGQAGFQCAASLRQEGFDGEVLLLGDETGLPYQRPPLSKGYLRDGRAERLWFRNEDFFAKNAIGIETGVRVAEIDRACRRVHLDNGTRYGFDHLVLAVGARNRSLPLKGIDLEGVLQLRTLEDAEKIRSVMAGGTPIVVIGGGFIGLEVAATASVTSAKVTVLEATHRLMSRVVAPPVSAHFLDAHRHMGVDIRLDAMARRILDDGCGRAGGVELEDGTRIDAGLVLVSTGVIANAELAEATGLYVHDGIRVNDLLETEDPSISAIGDCASFPFGHDGVLTRLESVQNAADQARCVARRLVGQPEPYSKVPWFWSDQGLDKLQIAGLTAGADHHVSRLSADASKLTVHCFRHDELIGIETVNAPVDHLAARKLLALECPLTLNDMEAHDFDLRAIQMEAATESRK